ncbi:MAG: PEGA domain-containing protein, partial [Planctomycetes bacterium]|nr:PEGA domain-containing protein [Planctomycetota bacterium]
ESGADLEMLEVRFDHPAWFVEYGRILVDHDGATTDLTVIFELDFELHRAKQIKGKVLDDSDAPVADVLVGVFALTGGHPSKDPSDTTSTRADGTFVLRSGGSGRYLIAAVSAHHEPAVLWTDASDSDAVLDTIHLQRGVAISGQIRMGTEPLSHATVSVDDMELDAGPGIRLGGDALGLRGTHFIKTSVKVETDQEGRFCADGLRAGSYFVALRRSWASGSWVFPEHPASQRRDVVAPADDVVIDLGGEPRIRFDIFGEGVPLPSASVTLSDTEFTTLNIGADSRGVATVTVLPERRYRATVTSSGFRATTIEVIASKDGGEIVQPIDLKREYSSNANQGSLILEFPGHPEIVRASIWPQADDRSVAPQEVEVVEGRARFTGILPGRYTTRCRLNGSLVSRFGGYLLDQEVVTDVPATGECRIELEPQRGGRLCLAARSIDGDHITAECSLQSVGIPNKTIVLVRHSFGGVGFLRNSVTASGPVEVDGALSPGLYRVEFRKAGYEDLIREVTISAGRTTNLFVIMKRKP